ncbi:hypothetical protein Vretifemale_11876 [Volvox reticuliferus]|nr:hypothetical protein Vretifemale_11876 [Volvox reticuliferus]
MLEFLTRKRSGDNAANTAAATASLEGRAGRSGLNRTVSIKAANAWRRAAAKALQNGGTAAGGGAMERKDSTLEEYERRKMEEAGGLKDVGNLLGGAAARKAYMRGLATKDGGMYAEDEPESNGAAADTEASRTNKIGGVHWGPQDAHPGGAEEEGAEVEDVDEEEEEADPWVRLTFLDRRYQVVRKAIRYIDAVEKVMGVAKQESADSSKPPQGGGGGGGDPDADPDELRAADESQLLLLNGGDDVSAAVSDSGGAGGAGSNAAAAGGTAAVAADGPGPDDTVDDACDEHLEQLYGPCGGRVEVGQVAGELPAAVLDKSKKSGQQRMRRAHSAIASPSGASVLVVVLEALRRGHEAARDDLVSERLAVLTALEPLRGLSDEHQAQLALGCTVVSLDTNQVIVRQCQLVDALFVVLEGEVRLLDDPDTTPTVAPPPQQPQQPAAGGAGSGGTTVNGASGVAASGGGNTAAATPSDSPFRTATAAAGGGKLMSLKIRRAAATLAALTLLGPGGSFGESVLGYPEDVAAAAAAAAAERESWEGDGGESTVPPSQYLATAMTSRPTKLLVMPRSLLVKYGYLRASLPPFANLRREAINGRRQQLQAGLQNRPAAAAVAAATAAATAAAVASNSGGGTSGVSGRTSTNGAGITRGASDSLLGVTPLPSLPSPTAPMVAGTFQTPRPPPKRPSEVLEQLGFKPVLRRLYNAGGKLGGAAAQPNGASPAAALGNNGISNCNHNSSSSTNNGISGGGVGGPNPLPPPLPSTHAINSFAPAPGGSDRQHRKDLLAASVLAANNPQSLWNAIARARGEEATSLPSVVHSTASSAAPTPSYRGSADGSFTSATGSPGGLVLPTPFSTSKMRPLRLSVSGVGNCANCNGSPSPVRRSSVSGLIGSNSPGGGGGGGISIPMLVSPTRGGGGGNAVTRVHATSTSAPNPHVACVQLPRLSAAGNSNSATATPTTGGVGIARPSIPGEPFLVRLEAAEHSPRSFSPQPSGTGNAGRSVSLGSLVNGGGSGGGTAVASLPLSVTLLGQRSGGHQPAARA